MRVEYIIPVLGLLVVFGAIAFMWRELQQNIKEWKASQDEIDEWLSNVKFIGAVRRRNDYFS